MNRLQAGLLYNCARALFGKRLLETCVSEVKAASSATDAAGQPLESAAKHARVKAALVEFVENAALTVGSVALNLLIEIGVSYLAARAGIPSAGASGGTAGR